MHTFGLFVKVYADCGYLLFNFCNPSLVEAKTVLQQMIGNVTVNSNLKDKIGFFL